MRPLFRVGAKKNSPPRQVAPALPEAVNSMSTPSTPSTSSMGSTSSMSGPGPRGHDVPGSRDYAEKVKSFSRKSRTQLSTAAAS